MTFALGKLPARPDAVKLKFANYVDTTKLPPLPAPPFGHQALVKEWGMLANDRLGDCAIAGPFHEIMLWNAEAGKTVNVTDDAVIKMYSAITGYNPKDPSSDQGSDVSKVAAYRRKTGLLDADGKRHKIGAYIALTPGDWTELLYATYLFDGVGIGVNFPSQWMTATQEGKPWDKLTRPNYEGGHYVTSVDAVSETAVQVVTWGQLQVLTKAGYEMANDETLAYASEEKLTNGVSLEGLDWEALTADLKQLTSL